jgi:hypothetical protein
MTYFTRLIGRLRNTETPAATAPEGPAASSPAPVLSTVAEEAQPPSEAEGPTTPVAASD